MTVDEKATKNYFEKENTVKNFSFFLVAKIIFERKKEKVDKFIVFLF